MNWPRPEVISGSGCIEKIPDLLKRENVRNMMVVTTGLSIGKKLAPQILEEIENAGIRSVLYAEMESNPTVTTVNKIQQLYLDNACDVFIAIGGGSPMDAAKDAAAHVVQPNAKVGQMAGLLKVMKKIPPFIAVPTTVGTGSETTIAAVITDSDTHHIF